MSPARAEAQIGIGGASWLRPSHSTVRTGPPTAVGGVSSGMASGDGRGAQPVEEGVGQRDAQRRAVADPPRALLVVCVPRMDFAFPDLVEDGLVDAGAPQPTGASWPNLVESWFSKLTLPSAVSSMRRAVGHGPCVSSLRS